MRDVSVWTLALGIALVPGAVKAQTQWAGDPVTAQQFIDYCLSNPDQCSLSVSHLTQGWERHWGADRLRVTASMMKIILLIAYAEAVVQGMLDPEERVPIDEWAAPSVQRDIGTLAAAWERLGQPARRNGDATDNSGTAGSDWGPGGNTPLAGTASLA